MLWIKALHVVFVVTWFAGLFYLPRLFIYHATATDPVSQDRFVVMERRLFVIMTIGAALAAAFGLGMVVLGPGYLAQGWLQVKLVLVLGLVGFHVTCWRLMQQLRNGTLRRSSRWLRWFNEVPTVLLLAIVILAIVKPF
ncbi:MAG TPA: CopD family protein [Steroidobacteraceae bacterium]|nr:CopD family protein [Steroidobacteraceae bacterium]